MAESLSHNPNLQTWSAYAETGSLGHGSSGYGSPADSLLRYFVYVRKSSEPDDRQVLSLESQKKELLQAFRHLPVVEVIEESRSAKAPGRPRFDAMIARIEKGEADGIIAWHPDRLSRNSVDAGRIIYDLDCHRLRDLKFAQYTFENTPEGKWMLSIVLGQSKYQVDKMVVDVERGLREKLDLGWLPGMAPIGYLNHYDPATGARTIQPDPERFALMRRLWEMMLTGAYTPPQLLKIADEEWGLRTRRRPKSGDKPLSRSAIYRVLTNPFYYGWFYYRGQLHKGQHEPMITEQQFRQVQRFLGRTGRPRPQKPWLQVDTPTDPSTVIRDLTGDSITTNARGQPNLFRSYGQAQKGFAFTGMIHCGECGGMITAEERWRKNKTNDGIRHYVYYHCTKRKGGLRGPRCRQPHIEVKELERQMDEVLATLTLPKGFMEWALEYLRQTHEQETQTHEQTAQAIEESYRKAQKQIDVLLDLRLRELISEEEFEAKRQMLFRERDRWAERRMDNQHNSDRWFELVENTLKFASTVSFRFQSGCVQEKRLILQILGSDLLLKDKILRFEPVAPFNALQNVSQCSDWRGRVDDVRTFYFENAMDVRLSSLMLQGA